MRIGIHLANFDAAGDTDALRSTLIEVGAAAEDAGISNISVMDHYFQMEFAGGPDAPMLEAYSGLAFLAARTSTVELQALVTGVTYRPPGLLAKIVTTLDVLSGGRAALGIGAAWYEREHHGLGVEFPPLTQRFERLEETLQIVLQMWSDDNGPYHGKHYQLSETLNNPQPLRRPHPPIMIGGTGEKKTLRLVAKYADATNMFAGGDISAGAIAEKLRILRDHCEREGRDYDDIRKTILYVGPGNPSSDPSALADELASFAEVGITAVHLMPGNDEPVKYIADVGTRLLPLL